MISRTRGAMTFVPTGPSAVRSDNAAFGPLARITARSNASAPNAPGCGERVVRRRVRDARAHEIAREVRDRRAYAPAEHRPGEREHGDPPDAAERAFARAAGRRGVRGGGLRRAPDGEIEHENEHGGDDRETHR